MHALSFFNPFSSKYDALNRSQKIPVASRMGIWTLSILVGAFTLGVGGIALFRLLVGRVTKKMPDKERSNVVENIANIRNKTLSPEKFPPSKPRKFSETIRSTRSLEGQNNNQPQLVVTESVPNKNQVEDQHPAKEKGQKGIEPLENKNNNLSQLLVVVESVPNKNQIEGMHPVGKKAAKKETVKSLRIKEEHKPYLKKFERWKKAQKWDALRADHYDWWMFPIDRDSSKGDRYRVNDEDIAALMSDEEFMKDYLRGAELVLEGWGWNVKESKPIENPHPTQFWDGWDIRLLKMANSFKLFKQTKYYDSAKAFFLTQCLPRRDTIPLPHLKELLRLFEIDNIV